VIAFVLFCALAAAVGGCATDAWIRRAAARKTRRLVPVGVLTGADVALAALPRTLCSVGT
jgi:hypothetical protein